MPAELNVGDECLCSWKYLGWEGVYCTLSLNAACPHATNAFQPPILRFAVPASRICIKLSSCEMSSRSIQSHLHPFSPYARQLPYHRHQRPRICHEAKRRPRKGPPQTMHALSAAPRRSDSLPDRRNGEMAFRLPWLLLEASEWRHCGWR